MGFNEVRIDDDCFVPQVLVARQELFSIEVFHELLELFVIFSSDAVPKFWGSVVVIVNARHVEILNVPPEDSPIRSDVKVGIGHSTKFSGPESFF